VELRGDLKKTGTPDVKPPDAPAFFTPSAAVTEWQTPPLKRQWVAEAHPVSSVTRALGHLLLPA